MIKLNEVTKEYIIEDGKKIMALDSVNLEMPDTGFCGIVGRSGCGKTTLLNILGRMDMPTSGYVEVDGININEISSSDLDAYRNWDVAYIYQDYNLISKYNVIDNIKLALRFQINDEKTVNQKAREALDAVGLREYEKRSTKHLSGGQQQRIAIARAIAKDARILLCDEPTGNLDIETARSIMELLNKVSQNRLVIIVTHDKELAEEFCSNIVHLKEGKVDYVEEKPENCLSQEEKTNAERMKNKKRGSLSVVNTFRYAFLNLKRDIVLFAIAFIVLIGCFSLMISLNSISNFDEKKALYNTLEVNDENIFPVTTYIDSLTVAPNGEYVYGPVEQMDICEEDVKGAYELLGEDKTIHKAYFLYKTIDDFSQKSDFMSDNYHDRAFNEFIAVDSYDNSSVRLLYGTYPKENNQVLIYDYMAYNILEQGKFKGVSQMEDLVGYDLQDVHTGLKMNITGIIKSDYLKCIDILKKGDDYSLPTKSLPFESAYLGNLRSIWGLSSFLETIKKENKWNSVDEKYFFDQRSKKELTQKDNEPMRIIDDVSKFTFIGDFNRYDDILGIIVSKKKFAEIMNVDVTKIDANYVNYEARDIFLAETSDSLSKLMGKSNSIEGYLGIIGVFEGDATDVFLYQKNGETTFEANGNIRQLYVEDFGNIRDTVYKLIPEMQTKEFYLAHPDYEKRGYMLESPYTYFIENAKIYLNYVKDTGNTLLKVAIVFISLGLFAFGIICNWRNKYEIGIYKSFGAKNKTIAIIFGTEMILVVILAMVVSIFVSKLLVNEINTIFTEDYVTEVSLVKVNKEDYWLPVFGGLGISLISIIASLIRLLVMQPINIIKSGKN